MYREISACRVCGSPRLTPVLNLGMQALTGVFPRSADEAVDRSPLELVKCGGDDSCGLVQLRHSCDSSQMYGANYGYRSGLNQSMVRHLEAKAAAIHTLVPLRPGDVVLDIGSNDGTLLRAFRAPGVELFGMDPTGAKFREFYPPEAHLIGDFFSASRFREAAGRRRARVVTSIAMFYDLEAPLQFMADVFDILTDDGVWVFEQSYLPQMLRMNSYDTICHEHLEYYALQQIEWMAEKTGFTIVDVELNAVNGGSFSVVAAKSSGARGVHRASSSELRENEKRLRLDSPGIYQDFAERTVRHRDALRSHLEEAVRLGQRVLGYGASTKGNVMLQYCGITPALLPSIAEVNPDKFGCFTPGTRIPIVSEAEARASRPDALLVLPWHFRESIVRREREYLEAGGRLLFPLPEIQEIDRANGADSRA